MRFNKRVQVGRIKFGKCWQAYGYATKVISLAKQTEIGIQPGDIVSKFIKEEGRLKAITVEKVYTYGRPPVKVYTFIVNGKEYITEAKGWKKTEIKTFPYKLMLAQNEKLKWKGEWKVNEASLFYPVKPYPGVV